MEMKLATETADPVIAANRVISTAEAAKLIGVSEDTYLRMSERGDAPARIQISTRRRGVRLQDLAAWLDKRARAAEQAVGLECHDVTYRVPCAPFE
jgi:predicted DNA-binding transcriptional regulator AlpA